MKYVFFAGVAYTIHWPGFSVTVAVRRPTYALLDRVLARRVGQLVHELLRGERGQLLLAARTHRGAAEVALVDVERLAVEPLVRRGASHACGDHRTIRSELVVGLIFRPLKRLDGLESGEMAARRISSFNLLIF
jgi:hypothetical protein